MSLTAALLKGKALEGSLDTLFKNSVWRLIFFVLVDLLSEETQVTNFERTLLI
jgi:hypothetical protein